MALKQPVGQKRLTNIAIVRLKSHGKRFEIACYKNKVLNWRDGIEKDLSEVIQTDTIFENVGRGKVAREQDLKSCFGTTNLEDICRKILKSGELQVSDKEREVHMDSLFRDIVQIVVERCVHPQTCRRLTPHTVENAIRSIGFSVQPDHAAKKQALKAIEALCAELPESFARAKMRLRIICPSGLIETIKTKLASEHSAEIESEIVEEGRSCAITFVCDPSHYRQLDSLTITHAADGVALQIVTATVLNDDADILSGATMMQPTPSGAAVPSPQAKSGYSAGAAPQGPAPKASIAPGGEQPKPKGMRCSNCDAIFEDVACYRSHCKSEWHNFNLKRKVKNMPPVTEDEFAEISLDTREGFIAVE
jgi:ribosome maturation protein SDO1